jgi:hypothetical protein
MLFAKSKGFFLSALAKRMAILQEYSPYFLSGGISKLTTEGMEEASGILTTALSMSRDS